MRYLSFGQILYSLLCMYHVVHQLITVSFLQMSSQRVNFTVPTTTYCFVLYNSIYRNYYFLKQLQICQHLQGYFSRIPCKACQTGHCVHLEDLPTLESRSCSLAQLESHHRICYACTKLKPTRRG